MPESTRFSLSELHRQIAFLEAVAAKPTAEFSSEKPLPVDEFTAFDDIKISKQRFDFHVDITNSLFPVGCIQITDSWFIKLPIPLQAVVMQQFHSRLKGQGLQLIVENDYNALPDESSIQKNTTRFRLPTSSEKLDTFLQGIEQLFAQCLQPALKEVLAQLKQEERKAAINAWKRQADEISKHYQAVKKALERHSKETPNHWLEREQDRQTEDPSQDLVAYR